MATAHDVSETAVEAGAQSDERPRGLPATWTAERAVHLLVGAAVIGLITWHIQFSTASICCGDFDGYYHIRWSQLLWEGLRGGDFPPRFIWLPLTTLNQNDYVDHHLLFHILQTPFTWFGDLRLGAKIAATIFASLALLACYWLIIRYRIKYPVVWLGALLASSAPFLYRLNMAKAPPLAIIFTVAGIYLLFERKYWLLAPLAFLYVWTYSLFVTLCAAAVVWSVVMAWSERRFEWRPLLWTGVGTIAGFVINPYFPKNIRLFIEHLWIKVRLGDFSTSVGSEWYPYDSWYFLGSCLVAFTAMLIGYVAFNGEDKRRAARPLFFLIFSTLLLVATFRSRRFVEYWPPFAILFAAFSLQPVLDGLKASLPGLPADVLGDLQPYLDRHERAETVEQKRREEHWKTRMAATVACALLIVLYINVEGIKSFGAKGIANEIASDAGPDRYRGGMEWIRTNVPAGEIVFNTDWDDFPKMFFYDTTHRYVSGLDPTYLLNKNPELSKLYENITLGREKDPGPLIRERFGARYVFTDNEEIHDDFYANAIDSGWFDKVYEDADCTVLLIRDQKGEPAPDSEDEGGEENIDDGEIRLDEDDEQ